eukprot:1180489-Prorocentrum_minimum.AAC.3
MRAATKSSGSKKNRAKRARARQADPSHSLARRAQETIHAKPAAAPKTELTNSAFRKPGHRQLRPVSVREQHT